MTRPWRRLIDTIRVRLSKKITAHGLHLFLGSLVSLVMLILPRGSEPDLLSYRSSIAFNDFVVIFLSIIPSYFTNLS
jgi:hypothetical protein